MPPVAEKPPIVALFVAVAAMPRELAFRLMAAAIALADAPELHEIGELVPSGFVNVKVLTALTPLLPAAAAALSAAASPRIDPVADPSNATALRPRDVTRASANEGRLMVCPELAPIWNC
jgi:hypothetical protein